MQGAGNRIVVVDQRERELPPPPVDVVRKLGDEDSGPGFDQLMWVSAAARTGSAGSYRVFNRDGSEVEQCGNGVRCVARLLAPEAGNSFTLDSLAGPVEIRVEDNDSISVNMGRASVEQSTLDVGGETHEVSLVSVGNPHCVLQVDDVDSAPVDTLGPAIENHARFPDRINAGFCQVQDRERIRLRVHERGVGETLACGTGACAAVVAGRALGLLDERVHVLLPGGQLVVSWRGGDSAVWMTGDAEILSEGIIDL